MKMSASGKCLQARKHVLIGGKRHHTNQSQNYMANHVMLLLGNRGKLRGGQQWKSDSSNDSDGDKDSEF